MSSTVSKTSTRLSKSDLTPEQDQAINHLYRSDHTFLIAKMGFGKCIVALTAAQEMLDDNHLKCILVIAPLAVCELTWGPEADKWDHITRSLTIVTGPAHERIRAMQLPSQIIVTNNDNVGWMLEHYGDRFDGLIIDETSKYKTPGSSGVRLLRNWVKKLNWVVGMSGTPVAESGMDIYAQALLLDNGAALGTRMNTFKETYCISYDYRGFDWQLMDGVEPALADALKDLVYLPDQGNYEDSLPDVIEETVWFTLDDEARELYHAITKQHMHGDYIYDSAGLRTLKLQQLAAGGLYGNADNGTENTLIYFDEARHESMSLIIGATDTPLVVVYQYTFQLEYFRRAFPDALILGAGSKMSVAELKLWNEGKIHLILMHPKAAAHGLNLQFGSHTLMHLSPTWSADNTAQCLARLRRRAQPHPSVTRILCLSHGTIDDEHDKEDDRTMDSHIVAALERKAFNEQIFMTALRDAQVGLEGSLEASS